MLTDRMARSAPQPVVRGPVAYVCFESRLQNSSSECSGPEIDMRLRGIVSICLPVLLVSAIGAQEQLTPEMRTPSRPPRQHPLSVCDGLFLSTLPNRFERAVDGLLTANCRRTEVR